jgi:hypothetical protein
MFSRKNLESLVLQSTFVLWCIGVGNIFVAVGGADGGVWRSFMGFGGVITVSILLSRPLSDLTPTARGSHADGVPGQSWEGCAVDQCLLP